MPELKDIKVIGFKKGGFEGSQTEVEISGYQVSLLRTEDSNKSGYLQKQNIIKIEINNPPTHLGIRIVVPYLKFMKGFELYEIVDRGGDEFMPALIVIGTDLFFSNNVIDRLPEPDFSLPFHVITFTMAIAGYFWVSLWRSYLKVLDHKYELEKKNK